MKLAIQTVSVLTIALAMAVGCSTTPSSSVGRADLQDDAQRTVAAMRRQDPSLDRFFNSSVGYAVFPTIAKGGLIIGGAHGRGVLYERGRFTSYCDVTQATFGAQIGGQGYSEIIFFENEHTLNNFKNGTFTFAAQATAVAVTSGAAANMNYENGVAVVVGDQAGLMAEAAIGGQKFTVVPANDAFASNQRQQPDRNNNNNTNVYGYADDQDQGWRNDSEYNRQYDASRSISIQGEVESISEFRPTRDSTNGRQLTVRADDGRTYVVHLGPVSYLDRQDNLRIQQGDRVTVTGSPTTFEGRQILLAREVTGRDNQRLELRDNESRPLWNDRTNNPQR